MATVTETAAAETAATLSPLAVGAAFRTLRGVLGMDIKAFAAQIDVEWPKLVQIETGALAATEDLLTKVRDKFLVDLKAAVAKVQPTWQQLHADLAAEIGPAVQAWQNLTSSAPAAEAPASSSGDAGSAANATAESSGTSSSSASSQSSSAPSAEQSTPPAEPAKPEPTEITEFADKPAETPAPQTVTPSA